MVRIIEAFIVAVCAGKTNETPKAYRSKLMRFARFLEAHAITMDALTFAHIEQFRAYLHDQKVVRRGSRLTPGSLSPFTIHTVLRTVKHFLTWSRAQGHLSFDPSSFRIAPPPRPDPKPVTAENALALFHAAARRGPDWERARNLAILYVLRDTAGRISAILRSDIDNLDLARGRLIVREKGDKPHTLYINAPTIEAIRLWLHFRPLLHPRDNTLFLSQRGTALKRSGLYSVLMRLRDTAGIQGRTNPHAFRHAWVRDALSAGEDLSMVSQTLAHSTIRTTADYYARWADGELKDAHSKYSPGAQLPIIKPADAQTE